MQFKIINNSIKEYLEEGLEIFSKDHDIVDVKFSIDAKGYYNALIMYNTVEEEGSPEIPMGISKWIAHGNKYGYLDYTQEQIEKAAKLKKRLDRIEKELDEWVKSEEEEKLIKN